MELVDAKTLLHQTINMVICTSNGCPALEADMRIIIDVWIAIHLVSATLQRKRNYYYYYYYYYYYCGRVMPARFGSFLFMPVCVCPSPQENTALHHII
jgi:hypothetical protein